MIECPICLEQKQAYFTCPRCNNCICNTCLLQDLNAGRRTCPLCRADIYDAIPQQIRDEIASEDRIDHADPATLGSRARRGRNRSGEDYDSADEIEGDATHIKIRYGANEIAFLRNDGKNKEITFDDGHTSFRIEYRDRKCYLRRKEFPDVPVPLNPLAPQCAILPPPPSF